MDVSSSDSELITGIVAGREAAFEALVRRYNRRLYRAARAVLRDETEAEDVVQEVYLRALVHLGAFRGESSLATWLTRIAVYEALSRLRHQRRARRLADQQPLFSPQLAPPPERHAYDDELRRSFETAIDDLPDTLRLAFVLRVVEGLSTVETARILDVSTVAVKVRVFRARARLRRALGRSVELGAAGVFEFGGMRCDRIWWSVAMGYALRA